MKKKEFFLRSFSFIIILSIFLLCHQVKLYAGDDIQQLKNEIETLKQRIKQLEDQAANQPVSPQRNFGAPNPQGGWDPFTEMERMQHQMDQIMHQGFGPGGSAQSLHNNWNIFDPDIDLKETADGYVITMDIPGMEKNNIQVEAKNHVLLVSGERKSETKENSDQSNNHFFKQERSFGSFSRSVPLPEDANTDKLTVEYEKGVLTVKVPKGEAKKKLKMSIPNAI